MLLLLFAIAAVSLPRAAARAESAHAQAESPTLAPSPNGKPPIERELPELPAPPSARLPTPKPEDLLVVDKLLARATSESASDRDAAVREVLEGSPSWVSALAFRVTGLAENSDKPRMKSLLEKLRGETKKERKSTSQKEPDEETPDSTSGDYLKLVLARPDPKSRDWQNLTRILILSRALTAIGTVEAVRSLIEIYVRFGEFLRIDTQRAFTRLGDKAVPALIEATRHPAEKIGRWAARQLDLLGKAIPANVVETAEPDVLADALRAYGRIRDIESAQILISFARSERPKVRLAARQAVALLGETGAWQLRDAYQDTLGKSPPRDWSWQRTARELFAEFDRSRQVAVERDFEAGLAAAAAGDLDGMRAAYDELLARDPDFDRKKELRAGYLDFARKYQGHEDLPKRALAAEAASRAARLSSGDTEKAEAQSLALALEADRLYAEGIADRTLLERALSLDPANRGAKTLLAKIEASGSPALDAKNRYAASAAIAIVALIAIAFIAARRKTSETPPVPAAPAADQPPQV